VKSVIGSLNFGVVNDLFYLFCDDLCTYIEDLRIPVWYLCQQLFRVHYVFFK